MEEVLAQQAERGVARRQHRGSNTPTTSAMPPLVAQPVRQRKKLDMPPSDVELADSAFLELVDRGANEEAVARLKAGQQINVADERGETAVHKATRRGDVAFVHDLLKFGAVPDYADVDGVTPIMIAIQHGRDSLISTFIQKGANMDARTRDGMTLLHAAVYTGHEQTLRLLLREPAIKALLEVRDMNGRTPLQMASYRSSQKCCELLCAAGADDLTRDKRGETCASLAALSGRRNSKEFFDKLAADPVRLAAAAAAKAAEAAEEAARRKAQSVEEEAAGSRVAEFEAQPLEAQLAAPQPPEADPASAGSSLAFSALTAAAAVSRVDDAAHVDSVGSL